MIRIATLPLPSSAADGLVTLQQEIDTLTSYSERVMHASRRFAQHNRPTSPIFREVRATLAGMCCGAIRCMYCEDSNADQVEHFRPKSFFPELVFVWLNYLYACGPCNRAKLNHFRMILDTRQFVDLRRLPRAPVIEPARGDAVLLDPRTDDPLDYLALDLVQTFHFVPRAARGSLEYLRAEYTISQLKLNERDFLPVARREAFGNYRARLAEYVAVKGTPAAQRLAADIVRCDHPTVFAEMKRQAHLIPELERLFDAAPEAHQW